MFRGKLRSFSTVSSYGDLSVCQPLKIPSQGTHNHIGLGSVKHRSVFGLMTSSIHLSKGSKSFPNVPKCSFLGLISPTLQMR